MRDDDIAHFLPDIFPPVARAMRDKAKKHLYEAENLLEANGFGRDHPIWDEETLTQMVPLHDNS